MRHTVSLLTVALMLLAATSTGFAQQAGVEQMTDPQSTAQLRAEMHRTVAELIEARATETPDEAKIEKLLGRVQMLRGKIWAQADVAARTFGPRLACNGRQCPLEAATMGRGLGRGQGWGDAQGRGRGGPGRGYGQGGVAGKDFARGYGLYGPRAGGPGCFGGKCAAGVCNVCPLGRPACDQACVCENCPRDCANCKCCRNCKACAEGRAACPLKSCCSGRCDLGLGPLGGYGAETAPPILPAKTTAADR